MSEAATSDATIVPVGITLGGRTGVTLWAPPWDEDGETWQAFLGVGETVSVFDQIADLRDYLQRSTENDLVDHPAYELYQTLPVTEFEPDPDFHFDFDAVPALLADAIEPEPQGGGEDSAGSDTDGRLDSDDSAEADEDFDADFGGDDFGADDDSDVGPGADILDQIGDDLDLAGRIAECTEDMPLIRMLEGATFAALVADDPPNWGAAEWGQAATELRRSWPMLLERLNARLSWYAAGEQPPDATPDEPVDFWGSVGIVPLSMTVDRRTGYTLRCYVDDRAVFLGHDLNVDVFTRPSDLIDFCRTETAHDLADLSTWPQVAGATLLDVTPANDERINLDSDSRASRELGRDLAEYCELADAQVALQETASGAADGTSGIGYSAAIAEIATCLRWHD